MIGESFLVTSWGPSGRTPACVEPNGERALRVRVPFLLERFLYKFRPHARGPETNKSIRNRSEMRGPSALLMHKKGRLRGLGKSSSRTRQYKTVVCLQKTRVQSVRRCPRGPSTIAGPISLRKIVLDLAASQIIQNRRGRKATFPSLIKFKSFCANNSINSINRTRSWGPSEGFFDF